ncbi:MAG: hypothetical protein FWC90_07785 [Oscillospiraceae bacterium]|nr:hypothetical protein [Oscillospiraceae bacterium]
MSLLLVIVIKYHMLDWIVNMRKSAVIIPFIALIAGAVGLYLRHIELQNVFNISGLPTRGASETIILIIVSCAFVLLALIYAVIVGIKYASPRGYENAFGTNTIAYPLFFFLVGIVWLVSTVIHFFEMNALETVHNSHIFFAILSALAAISLMLFAIEIFKDPKQKLKFVLSIIPSLFLCFWILSMYRENAANPVLLSYVYYFFALVFSLLGFYMTSGFVFDKSAPGKTIFFCLAAIFFCFITLADSHDIGIRIILGLLIAINAVNSAMLIRRLVVKSAVR